MIWRGDFLLNFLRGARTKVLHTLSDLLHRDFHFGQARESYTYFATHKDIACYRRSGSAFPLNVLEKTTVVLLGAVLRQLAPLGWTVCWLTLQGSGLYQY